MDFVKKEGFGLRSLFRGSFGWEGAFVYVFLTAVLWLHWKTCTGFPSINAATDVKDVNRCYFYSKY